MGTHRRVLRTATSVLALAALLAAFAAPVAAQNEGCPSPTEHLVTFTWDGSAFVPAGGSANGVAVWGNASSASWSSDQTISALVLTAGGASYNVALDWPETVGTVSPDNYAVFGGADLESLGFCTGEKTRPDTTTSGPSVELSKTAQCATIGTDGMATVTGTITAELDSLTSARITTAVDSILAGGNVIVHQATVPGLVGVVLTPEADEVTVSYSVTFDPGDATSFENFVEVTLEDAQTGEDRQKVYNARAAFSLCAVPSEEPSAEPSSEPSQPSQPTEPSSAPSETGGVEGGNPTPTPGDLPDTAAGDAGSAPTTAVLSIVLVMALGTLIVSRLARQT